jgi:hypothetical protein
MDDIEEDAEFESNETSDNISKVATSNYSESEEQPEEKDESPEILEEENSSDSGEKFQNLNLVKTDSKKRSRHESYKKIGGYGDSAETKESKWVKLRKQHKAKLGVRKKVLEKTKTGKSTSFQSEEETVNKELLKNIELLTLKMNEINAKQDETLNRVQSSVGSFKLSKSEEISQQPPPLQIEKGHKQEQELPSSTSAVKKDNFFLNK